MDPAFHPEITNINGINLSDYFPDKSSYNPVVYIHKRYLPKENEKNTLKVSKTQDKGQQFSCNKIHDEIYKTKIINIDRKDPLLEQTIKFAKDIIPLTIPPSTNISPNQVYYTIKSNKKAKRKHDTCEHKSHHNKDSTLVTEKPKHEMGTVQKEKCKRTKVNHSTDESISRSSQNNTIDDINEHRSLCYSLSETSEQKHVKDEARERNISKKHNKRVIASESFEAIAAEYMNSDSNIKINLMNEKDKRLLCERISDPIVKTIKELFQFNNQGDVGQEFLCVQKAIENQANKLDNIIEKLSRIENKIDKFTNEQNDGITSKKQFSKTSKLEEIGKDILEVKENFSSEEELVQVDLLMKRRSNKSASITSNTSIVGDNDSARERETGDDFAKGENIPEYFRASTSQLGVKPERPNRLPARFCWTDAVKTKRKTNDIKYDDFK